MPPAIVVFRDFQGLSREISLDYYRKAIGERIRSENLVPAQALLRNQGHTDAAFRALNRYLLESYNADRPLGLQRSKSKDPFNPKTAYTQLKQYREQIQRLAPGYRNHLKQYHKLEKRLIQLYQARTLIQAGLKIDARAFDLDNADFQSVSEVTGRADREQDYLSKKLKSWETAVHSRIKAAVQFLNLKAMAAKMPSIDISVLNAEVGCLFDLMQRLDKQHDALKNLIRVYNELSILVHQLEEVPENSEVFEAVFNARLQDAVTALKALRSPLTEIAYPFDHVRQGLSVGEFLIDATPGNGDFSEVLDSSYQAIDRHYQLIARCVARLCHIAEAVESALALPPLLGKAEPIVSKPQHDRSSDTALPAGGEPGTDLEHLLAATRKNFGNPPRKVSGRPLRRLKIPKNKLGQAIGSKSARTFNKEQARLLVDGQIVWAHLVMANVKLFDPGKTDYPAAVVYSQDAAYDGDLEALEKIATAIFALKEAPGSDPELAEFARVMADEQCYFFNEVVPQKLTEGRTVFFTVLPVHRKHLPDDYLAASWFPLLVLPYQCQNVMILPVEFWDSSLVEYWRSGCKL